MPYFKKHETPDFFFLLTCFQTAKAMQSAQFKDLAKGLCDHRLNPFSPDEIELMTDLKLEDLAFDETSGQLELYKRNKTSSLISHPTGILFSNRPSEQGEMRGELLKNRLTALKTTNPEMSLHDAILDLTYGKNSDLFIKFRAGVEDMGFDAHTAEQFVESLIELMPNDPCLTCSEDDLYRDSDIHKTLEALYEIFIFKKDFKNDFDSKLALLDTKIIDLASREETTAEASASILRLLLKNAEDRLFIKPYGAAETKSEFEEKLMEFKSECEDVIKLAKPMLESHRGWKQFFADLAFLLVSVLTFGTANLVSKKVNGSYGFFNTKTDSIQIVENIERLAMEIQTTDAGDDEDNDPENSTSSM